MLPPPATRSARLLRTVPWSADEFDAVYRTQQQRTRDRLEKRKQRASSPAARARLAKLPPDLRERIELDILRAQQRRAGSRKRHLEGLRWPGGYLNGRLLAPFVERRLRSPLHPMLRLFVAGTPRVQRGLSAGRSKERLFAFGSKLVLLDEPHVSFNAVMRSIIRIDIDETFASWDALRDAIEAAGVPPPNLAVAHVEPGGRVIHPHAYWLLAQAVCFSGRGRPKPQRLFSATERALVEALRALGADPGGLSNNRTGKNPLSEYWSCQVMSATPFNLTNGQGAQPGLVALADHVPPIFEKPRAFAAPQELDVATLLGQSNGVFEVLKRFTFAEVAKFHPQGQGQGEFEDFARATVAYALRLPVHRLSEAALEKRARRQAQYVWDRFARLSTRRRRGRCQAACAGRPLREKQQIGAHAVAEAKRQQSLDRLIAAYWDLVNRGEVAAGAMPINRHLAAAAGLAVRTVQNHRPALTAAIEAGGERRCEDKKESLSSLEYLPTNSKTSSLQRPQGAAEHLPAEHADATLPEVSGARPKMVPPLASLTIDSPARELAPDESFERSDAPTAVRAPGLLAGLVLFPPVPTRHPQTPPPVEPHPALLAAGFRPLSGAEAEALLNAFPPAPAATGEVTLDRSARAPLHPDIPTFSSNPVSLQRSQGAAAPAYSANATSDGTHSTRAPLQRHQAAPSPRPVLTLPTRSISSIGPIDLYDADFYDTAPPAQISKPTDLSDADHYDTVPSIPIRKSSVPEATKPDVSELQMERIGEPIDLSEIGLDGPVLSEPIEETSRPEPIDLRDPNDFTTDLEDPALRSQKIYAGIDFDEDDRDDPAPSGRS